MRLIDHLTNVVERAWADDTVGFDLSTIKIDRTKHTATATEMLDGKYITHHFGSPTTASGVSDTVTIPYTVVSNIVRDLKASPNRRGRKPRTIRI